MDVYNEAIEKGKLIYQYIEKTKPNYLSILTGDVLRTKRTLDDTIKIITSEDNIDYFNSLCRYVHILGISDELENRMYKSIESLRDRPDEFSDIKEDYIDVNDASRYRDLTIVIMICGLLHIVTELEIVSKPTKRTRK